mgnify:CR=1 FL=1
MKKRILWGISGIGNGHSNRQAPLIAHYAKTCTVVIFAYQESHRNFTRLFRGNKNVTVVRIDVPFWAGKRDGLDFLKTASVNAGKDFLTINCQAFAKAERLIGRPDLVVTDYEPMSAQYAYAFDAPLVTFDQQSKYLCGDFPATLGGQAYRDEVVRLRMFFPAATRIACSFFRVKRKAGSPEVAIVPPPLKESIISLRRSPKKGAPSILLYVSSQREFVQTFAEVMRELSAVSGARFHVFVKGAEKLRGLPHNVSAYEHGDKRFHKVLAECNGIVSTAGHMLLSEAMHLGIPVYAIPLAVYEQQMNAHVVDANGFGVSRTRIERKSLAAFIRRLPAFASAIERDRSVLLRRPGQNDIIGLLDRVIGKGKGSVS